MPLETFFGLSGKRALVTGGTSGIGLAIAEAFASAGARVLAASDREEDCAAAAARLEGVDPPLETLFHRLSGRDSAERLALAAHGKLGGAIDILVSNAGVRVLSASRATRTRTPISGSSTSTCTAPIGSPRPSRRVCVRQEAEPSC